MIDCDLLGSLSYDKPLKRSHRLAGAPPNFSVDFHGILFAVAMSLSYTHSCAYDVLVSSDAITSE